MHGHLNDKLPSKSATLVLRDIPVHLSALICPVLFPYLSFPPHLQMIKVYKQHIKRQMTEISTTKRLYLFCDIPANIFLQPAS